MIKAWVIGTCEVCEGEEILYCFDCEKSCDHDKVCRKCNATGWVPRKVEGFYLWGYDKDELFGTRRQALENIPSYCGF